MAMPDSVGVSFDSLTDLQAALSKIWRRNLSKMTHKRYDKCPDCAGIKRDTAELCAQCRGKARRQKAEQEREHGWWKRDEVQAIMKVKSNDES
jgi:DnaJ-class molecular chaperone